MSFRTVLAPFIKIFQWSGLSPFPLVARKPKSPWRNKTFQILTITLIIIMVNVAAGVEYLVRNFSYYQPEMGYSKMFAHTHILMIFITRTNAITVLIESWAKRSSQAELLATFDEIENIFVDKFCLEIDKCQLRFRFCKFMIIWILKIAAFMAFAILCSILLPEQYTLYGLIIIAVPLHTTSLFYAQWMMFVDVIRFNIQRINDCLMKMNDGNRIDQLPDSEQIFQVEAFSNRTIDACENLVSLRRCLSKIWLASRLINQCFRWSFLTGNGCGVYFLVVHLYWILYRMVDLNYGSWPKIAVYTIFVCIISTDFLVVSMICESIDHEVSCVSRLFLSMR